MARPRTPGFVGVSLDGFLARPDGAIDWLTPFEGVEHGYFPFFNSIVPVLIGEGLPLFGGVKVESGMELEQVTQHERGMVQLRYRAPVR